jgi:diguanylate cyclase (GGDEF)-like protein/PAS domain S-box-containing protein
VVKNACVTLIISDESQQQWLYALLSRYYHVETTLSDDGNIQQADVYLFDNTTLAAHLAWLTPWRQPVQPDSPFILLLNNNPISVLSEDVTTLVDEVLSNELDAEQLRLRITQWLQLRESVRVWQRAANSRQSANRPIMHPTQALNCPLPQKPVYPTPLPPKITTPTSHFQLPIEQESALMKLLFDTASQGMFVSDMEGRLLVVNPAFAAIVGYAREELQGVEPDFLLPLRVKNEYYSEFRHRVAEQHGWDGELSARRKDGDVFPLWLTLRYQSSHPELVETVKEGYYIGIITDLSVSRMLEDSVLQLSHTNSLSELNRVLLEDRLSLAIRQSESQKKIVAVFYINLRRFRLINDHDGYAIGDWVLMAQLERLRHLVGNQGLVSRLFADNYVIVLSELDDLSPAQLLSEQIVEQLSQPLFYGNKEITSQPVIGVSDYPQHGQTAIELIHNADTAMNCCRRDGAGNVQFYTEN